MSGRRDIPAMPRFSVAQHTGQTRGPCSAAAAAFPGELIHADCVPAFGARLGLAWPSCRAHTKPCAQTCRHKAFLLQPVSADIAAPSPAPFREGISAACLLKGRRQSGACARTGITVWKGGHLTDEPAEGQEAERACSLRCRL